MNILFLTLGHISNIEEHGIYSDLLRCFRDHGHSVYIITPYEKRMGKATEYKHENGVHTLALKVGNVTKSANLIEKGIATVSLESLYIRGIKQYFPDVRFDLVLYSTPPITFVGAIEYVKKRDHARTYLLLKDIFPQNAVDIGMMSTSGAKGIMYKWFRSQEKKLYAVSDRIGCMSRANVDYLLKHNPEVDPKKVEICPNSIEITDKTVDPETRKAIRRKYGIPQDKTVFVYGGNLGKPQGIPFIIECLRESREIEQACFLIVGDGSEYGKLEEFEKTSAQENFRLMKRLPKEDYETLVGACDVGLIFLDHRFTIPNFPSRLLSYMQARLPVLAVTDPNTDVGKVITEGGFGWWCESSDAARFSECVKQAIAARDTVGGEKEFRYLTDHFNVEDAYGTVLSHFM